MRTALPLVFALLAAGCTTTSGVHAVDADTFMVRTSASYGAGDQAAALDSAYKQAEAKCADRSVQRVKETVTPRNIWRDNVARVSLEFRCVAPAS